MHFLIDAQLTPALARWLTSAGYQAAHVADHDMTDADDGAIWDFALENNFIIVSKDDDFATRRTLVDAGPQIVWVRFGNASRSDTIARFARLMPDITAALNRREPLIETA